MAEVTDTETLDNNKLSGYPKIYNHYTPEGKAVLSAGGTYVVQEKIDGSQFSFGIRDGVVLCKSKNCALPEQDAKDFQKAVTHVHSIKDRLMEGYTYRGEFLKSNKQNVIRYDTAPKGGIVLFDVQAPDGRYTNISGDGLAYLAEQFEVDYTRYIVVESEDAWRTEWDAPTYFKELAEKWTPTLGGRVEGFVVKRVEPVKDNFGHLILCKYVTDEFRETQSDGKPKSPHKEFPTIAELAHNVGADMCTEVRFAKCVAAMRDMGVELPNNKNIGRAVSYLVEDCWKEGRSTFEALLLEEVDKYRKQLTTAATNGFAKYLQNLPTNEVS